MIAILAACVMLAGCLVVAFKLGRIDRYLQVTEDRYFTMQEEFRKAGRAFNVLGEKVDHVAQHFVYPPITDPVGLPSLDDETPVAKPKKHRRR